MDSVYLETTIIGHVAGRRRQHPLVGARQDITREWWRNEAEKYDRYVSQLVIDECSVGDSEAAAERLSLIAGLPLLDVTLSVDRLAAALVDGKAVPASEPRDAFHISLAAVNGVKYLLT